MSSCRIKILFSSDYEIGITWTGSISSENALPNSEPVHTIWRLRRGDGVGQRGSIVCAQTATNSEMSYMRYIVVIRYIEGIFTIFHLRYRKSGRIQKLMCCWNDCEWLAWLIELCCVWIGNVLVLRIVDWSYELLIEFLFEFVMLW